MNKEILNEINRFREISGLRLLSEASIGGGWIDELLDLLGKSADEFDTYVRSNADEFATGFKKEIDDAASILNKTSDEILSSIKAGNLPANEADEILRAILKTDGIVKDRIVSSYILSNPSLIDTLSRIQNDSMAANIRNSADDIVTLKSKLQNLKNTIADELTTEYPEIQEALLKRFDEFYEPILREIESRGASNARTGTQRVTISTIGNSFDEFTESIRPKNAAEQFDTVLDLIKSKRAAGQLEELTEEQIKYAEDYVKNVLGLKTGTVGEVLDATEKELKKILDTVKNGKGAAKEKAIKDAKGFFNSFKVCKEIKTPGACLFSLAKVGGSLGIVYAILQYEWYGSSEVEEDKRFVKSKLPCLKDDNIDITFVGSSLSPEIPLDSSLEVLFGQGKQVKIKGKNSKGLDQWVEIFYDTTSKKFKDGTGNPVTCPSGSDGDTSGFVVGDGTPVVETTPAAAAATDVEFKTWWPTYAETELETVTIDGGQVTAKVKDGGTFLYKKVSPNKFEFVSAQ